MYNLILKKNVDLKPDSIIPAGVYSVDQNAAPAVSKGNQIAQIENISFKLISPPVSSQIRLRLNIFDTMELGSTISLSDDLYSLDLSPFEKLLIRLFYHIEEVANNPILDLKKTEVKLPTSRVKRFSPRALTYLSGHSEDWQCKTFISVLPKNILAIIHEDNWSIYENRLFVTLSYKIDYYLNERIKNLEQISLSYDEIQEIFESTHITKTTRESLQRCISDYFKNSSDVSDASEMLKNAKDSLNILKKRNRALWTLPIFRNVKQDNSIKEINLTNTLQHHPHYRFLPLLWNKLGTVSLTDKVTIEEFEEQQQQLIDSVVKFSFNCIHTALLKLHFTQNCNNIYEQKKTGRKITVEHIKSTILLKDSLTGLQLNFTALPSSPLDYFNNQKADTDTIVIFPSESGLVLSYLDGPMNPYLFSPESNSIFTLPISPLSLYTEELYTSIVFRWLFIPLIKRMPYEIDKIPSLLISFLSEDKELSTCIAINQANIKIYDYSHKGANWDILNKAFEKYLKKKNKKKDNTSRSLKELQDVFLKIQGVFTCPLCGNLGTSANSSLDAISIKCNHCNKVTWGFSDRKERCEGKAMFIKVDNINLSEKNMTFKQATHLGAWRI